MPFGLGWNAKPAIAIQAIGAPAESGQVIVHSSFSAASATTSGLFLTSCQSSLCRALTIRDCRIVCGVLLPFHRGTTQRLPAFRRTATGERKLLMQVALAREIACIMGSGEGFSE